jgi:hypothetical protein
MPKPMNEKKPAEAGFFTHGRRSVVAAHDAEQLQQADEQVVDLVLVDKYVNPCIVRSHTDKM